MLLKNVFWRENHIFTKWSGVTNNNGSLNNNSSRRHSWLNCIRVTEIQIRPQECTLEGRFSRRWWPQCKYQYETEICNYPPAIQSWDIIAYYGILWDIVEYYGFISPAYPIHPSSFFGRCRTSQTSSSPRHLISAQGTLPKITTANSRFTRFNRSAKGPKAKLVAPTAISSSARLCFKQWETHGKTFNRLFLCLRGTYLRNTIFFVGSTRWSMDI